MITQKIEHYKDEKPFHAPVVHQPHMVQQHQSWHRNNPLQMGKLEFAMFVKTLGIKEGDLVTYDKCKPPLTVHQCNLVVDIDQVHKFVDWGHLNTGPKILTLASISNVTGHAKTSPTWKGGTNNWRKVSPDDWPEEWKKHLGK